jgi:CBS domain-containing protein
MPRYDFDRFSTGSPARGPRAYDHRSGRGARGYDSRPEWGGGRPGARGPGGRGEGFGHGFRDEFDWAQGGASGDARRWSGAPRVGRPGGWTPGRGADDLFGSPYEYGDLYDDAGYTARRGPGAPERGGRGDAARLQVREIMTEEPEAVTVEATLSDVARRMKELNVGIMPVVDDETNRRLEGVITDRDLAVRALAEGRDGSATVREFMTREVETVSADAPVYAVMDAMKRARVRRVPVVDAERRLLGIVAQADLAVTYAGLDREREAELAEVVERISEPGAPRLRGGYPAGAAARGGRGRDDYDRDLTDRLRHGADRLRDEVQDGWRELRDTAREWMGRAGGGRG